MLVKNSELGLEDPLPILLFIEKFGFSLSEFYISEGFLPIDELNLVNILLIAFLAILAV
jgi:hypothetical protein